MRGLVVAVWQHIVPGTFDNTTSSDLFFYNPKNGLTKTFKTDGAGNITLLKETTWLKRWQRIVPGDVGGTSNTDLVLYDRWTRP